MGSSPTRAISSSDLLEARLLVLWGYDWRRIARCYGKSPVALHRQFRRRFGYSIAKGVRHSKPLPPHLLARTDQGLAGLRNWREDPAGEDGICRLIARLVQ